MLTVKHITIGGEEFIEVGRRVNYVPAEAKHCAATTGPNSDSLWLERMDGQTVEFTGGTAFVMNDIGKTVARYDMGASPVPLVSGIDGDPRQQRGLAGKQDAIRVA